MHHSLGRFIRMQKKCLPLKPGFQIHVQTYIGVWFFFLLKFYFVVVSGLVRVHLKCFEQDYWLEVFDLNRHLLDESKIVWNGKKSN